MRNEDEGAFSECPSCDEVTDHSIIKRAPQGEGEDVLVRCGECSCVHKIMIRPPKPVMVKATLSDGRESSGVEIEVDEDEVISVGDMFEHEEITWMVTRIDNDDSRPENALRASKIFSINSIKKSLKLKMTPLTKLSICRETSMNFLQHSIPFNLTYRENQRNRPRQKQY